MLEPANSRQRDQHKNRFACFQIYFLYSTNIFHLQKNYSIALNSTKLLAKTTENENLMLPSHNLTLLSANSIIT